MSRPKPIVLLEQTSKISYITDQILEAVTIWAVFYKNSAFNLKSFNSLAIYPGPKYKKTIFVNQGHASNLARKLNKQFDSGDFTVVKLANSGK